MASDPVELFEQNAPPFDFSEMEEAVRQERLIQSFMARPVIASGGKIIAVAIKWKLANGTTETVLLAPYAALVLGTMLSHLEENKWTELATILPDATPQ
jgi:hypothetical protein